MRVHWYTDSEGVENAKELGRIAGSSIAETLTAGTNGDMSNFSPIRLDGGSLVGPLRDRCEAIGVEITKINAERGEEGVSYVVSTAQELEKSEQAIEAAHIRRMDEGIQFDTTPLKQGDFWMSNAK